MILPTGAAAETLRVNTMSEVHEGGCLCRAIRYRVKGDPIRAYVCHCTFCQHWTSSAFAVITWFEDKNVEVVGDGIATYEHRIDETDRWFRLHFCSRCGTTVMGTEERQPGIRLMMVGTLDDPNWVKPNRQIWTRSAQHWMVFPENLERFEKGTQHSPGTKPL